MAELSPLARDYGRRVAAKLLDGRKGHGGGPCLSRVMREADLIALAGLAFDAGLNAAQGRIDKLEAGLAQARAALHGASSDADAPLISQAQRAIAAALAE